MNCSRQANFLTRFLSDTPITAVLFAADHLLPGNFQIYTLDDLHYCPVPVPPALWLFGSGLLGLVGFRFRRQQA